MGDVFSSLCETRVEYFKTEQLRVYSECTYFTEAEINKLYRKFSALNREILDSTEADVKTRLSFDEVQCLSDLKQCPFAFRLCEVFSTDGNGINFEDFLDMMSAFNHRAPWNLKAAYAFRIFDFNDDSRICLKDIEKAVRCLTGKGKYKTTHVL